MPNRPEECVLPIDLFDPDRGLHDVATPGRSEIDVVHAQFMGRVEQFDRFVDAEVRGRGRGDQLLREWLQRLGLLSAGRRSAPQRHARLGHGSSAGSAPASSSMRVLSVGETVQTIRLQISGNTRNSAFAYPVA